jgi:hypothetical protein
MQHHIEHREPLLGRGVNLIVHLAFTPEEQEIIRKNNMARLTIVEAEPTYTFAVSKDGKKEKVEEDNNVYFSHLYQRRTSWHVDSKLEAKDFHARLFEGLKRFKDALALNSTGGLETLGDFEPIPPPEFALAMIPDYMWAEHAYLLAESGGGKTQLLQTIIAQQMQKTRPPGFVVIDSQNKMLQELKNKFPDAIMIDPDSNPPSLDLFAPNGFDDSPSLAPTLDTFKYLFEAGSQPLTDRQYTPFSYGIALMLVGYPKAFGHHATIEDFEDYLNGAKKGMELTPRAHQAVDAMDDDVKPWYYSQYANYRQSHSEILQRLTNICGPFTPLRPLFKKQTSTLNILDTIENGGMLLVNTNRHLLGAAGSSFFGRFFFKMLDRQIGGRETYSHPLLFIVDEVQQYFDASVMIPFLNLARKRNVACIFAHQRLADVPDQTLRDALLGVGTLLTTNSNTNDVREISLKFRVEQEQVHAWRREYAERGERPRYADFGAYFRGKHSADTFRLTFGQLEKLTPRTAKQQARQEESKTETPRQETPKQERPKEDAPIDDSRYDDRYDLLWSQHLSPAKAKRGTVMTVILPSKRSHLENIPAGTKHGYRFCVKGQSQIRRPDGSMGNVWIELEIAQLEDF